MKRWHFSIDAISSPYKELLQRELESLKSRKDVLAVGLIGSVARGDTWAGSDLDLEIILKGERPTKVVLTEQDVSVDYVFISEKHTEELYPDTVPIYDPKGIMSRALEGLDRNRIRDKLEKSIEFCTKLASSCLEKALSAVDFDLYSALCFVHLTGMYSGSGIVLASTGISPGRRPVSKLERVLRGLGKTDLFNSYLSLYGIPDTLGKADLLCRELREGFQEIWAYFRERSVGPPYILQQPSAEPYFRNRIEPIYEYDRRDFVRIAYAMFPCIMLELFRIAGEREIPSRIFCESRRFTGSAASWAKRYRKALELIPKTRIPLLAISAERFHREIQALLKEQGTTHYL